MAFKSNVALPTVGKIVKHPSGKKVKIVRLSFFLDNFGQYQSMIWWKEVLKNGKLSKKLRNGKIWT